MALHPTSPQMWVAKVNGSIYRDSVNLNKEIGSAIRKARKAKGLNLSDFSPKSKYGIAKNTLQKVEDGSEGATFTNVVRAALLFDCDLAAILKNNKPKFSAEYGVKDLGLYVEVSVCPLTFKTTAHLPLNLKIKALHLGDGVDIGLPFERSKIIISKEDLKLEMILEFQDGKKLHRFELGKATHKILNKIKAICGKDDF